MNLQADTTIIQTLRATRSDFTSDRWMLELRLRSALEPTHLGALRLGPEAILCVRHLRSRIPKEGSPESSRWTELLQIQLRRLEQTASRPIQGPVPLNAEAVIFANRAELLACLARDQLANSLNTNWWWHGLERELLWRRGVVQVWLETPECIPGAIQVLERTSSLRALSKPTSQPQAKALLWAVIARFGLRSLARALEVDPGENLPDLGLGQRAESIESKAAVQPAAPWRAWATTLDVEHLSTEFQLLLGVALTLARAPAVARSEQFAQAVHRWLIVRQGSIHFLALAEPAPESVVNPEAQTTTFESSEIRVSAVSSLTSATDFPELLELEGTQHTIASLVNPEQPHANTIERDLPTPTQHPDPLESLEPFPSERFVQTAFGGVFYLINVALTLGLYPDFTRPLDPGLALPIFDLLALLGWRLTAGQLGHDPLWGVLASDAQDHDELCRVLDQHFTMPDEWRVPPAWLEAFPARQPCQWFVTDGRLRVLHPDGFYLLDLIVQPEVQLQLEREMRAYSNPNVVQANLATPTPGLRLNRWLDQFEAYLRARLERAIGKHADLGLFICAHHVRVRLSATQLEVQFWLEDLPLELRLAGLDRTPGWVPAAGREIRFEFINRTNGPDLNLEPPNA
jgi:hypothetical protein